MSERPKDYAYEALAEVTATDMNGGRGELNAALKLIREQTPELADDSFMLAEVVRARAKMYRSVMGDVLLTPTALAKHWQRVWAESQEREKTRSTNQPTPDTECATCAGDRFVVVGTRPPVVSPWATERGIEPVEGEMYEEMAACPDCNQTDTSFWRGDGTKSRALDPEKVRELMRR